MLNIKAKVYATLVGDSALVALLGSSSKILFAYPNDFTALPVVTYQEINQTDEEQGYWDDTPNSVESTIQVDVWVSSGSTTNIVQRIDTIMHGLLFNTDYSADMYEPDTKIQHRVLRYRRSFTADDLD